MIITPNIRGFLCTTAHPAGCAANVKNQIDYVNSRGPVPDGPSRVLVIGASAGYGLASRIVAAFGSGAGTLGLFYEKNGTQERPGTAGWYNSAAFHKFAGEQGLYAKSISGDAFSEEIKQKTIETIRADLGQVDLVVYSLAAPRRKHPVTGVIHNSTLKPVGADLVQKGVNTDTGEVEDFRMEQANQEEIDNTVAVMGGEDWQMWIEALDEAGVLADGAKTTAYTYLGDKMTWDIYWHGTIGAAKKDLDKRVIDIRERLAAKGGDARVSVLEAVVTQASSAIPVMPIYLSLLFKVMKAQGTTHEGCIEQVDGLFRDSLYGDEPFLDDDGRLRADRKELDPAIQAAVGELWEDVSTETLRQLSDFDGYQHEFLQLFGFEVDGVDYAADVNPEVPIDNMV